ncbi:UDP-N-acetylmuramoyl-L-alanyl-D-glutamate--2, 6-diaminopimelate ligase [Candidatus Nitrotoga sp. HW29]|uniref:UDP-N-acetylmuramoyl-L-alanyl-D-glutamate--2, 6-diaminopimelate ligase n=1 Tax=Candidatus Nitrotoga sp. HW29 TaxID=2886963 RepID=UPI001EF22E4C|nr:UDP-N-acetylmuramoyl-L-alanyl-D-glutamate--2,6-diaminopimelate ligase [Candidatus Nitrotoga sp. HW29]CAH1904394.1 UDP-N-acetylmuramoyl-L-alanyl-D-glutamate--2, 6-diaminopimelate ligase [Candidatus Nitrotoga sp. HW29]
MSFHFDLITSLGVKVTRLVTDSRAITPGDTFIAYPGSKADGRQFIKQAIANGANAVIWEALGFSWNEAWQLPNLAVADLHHHAGKIADHVYGSPSQRMWVIGITGTNGKTSCCHWIAQSFCALSKKTALIGTLGNGFRPSLQPTLNTTPDAIRLHELFADYLAQDAQAVAMEVSSHALEQGRVNGVQFDVALLTNLSRDHLDYHGDMHRYAAAKRRLFDWQQLKYVVLNLDDAFGAEVAEQLQNKDVEVVGYGLTDAALTLAERLGLRMVYGNALHMGRQGFNLQIHSSWGGGKLQNKLIGRFNVANLLGVMAVLLVSGVTVSNALHELSHISAVPGRMQTFGESGRPTVVVDYAHTPDALEKVLQAGREIVGADDGKLICVFGCGGDRDRGKRPLMGAIATQLADLSIITSDNPRSEAPLEIIAAIVSGITAGKRETTGTYQIIEDRASAIAQAVLNAHATDIVLIAGKGHELYQEIKGVKYPFSDAEVAQRALLAWRSDEARA